MNRNARAVRADPLGLGTRVWFLSVAVNAHENDLAIAEATRLISEHPTYSEGYHWRAMARIVQGDLDGARSDLGTAGSLGPKYAWLKTNDAVLASREGNLAEARRVRDELVHLSASTWVSPMAIGRVEQALGDYDAAFAHYERAYQARDFLCTLIHTDPSFRLVPPGMSTSIDADPRWSDLVRRIGLGP